MKTAAAYIRVSTDEQTEYSPDSQLKHIQRYAGSHSLEIPPAYVFIDEGISGKTACLSTDDSRSQNRCVRCDSGLFAVAFRAQPGGQRRL